MAKFLLSYWMSLYLDFMEEKYDLVNQLLFKLY